MRTQQIALLLITSTVLFACSTEDKSDAYGNFEASSVTISAKGNGELSEFIIQEGASFKRGEQVGLIDTTQLHLEKLQLEAQLNALLQKTKEAGPDIRVLEERKANFLREKKRTEALLEEDAATRKQLDDYEGEIELINQQISSLRRSIEITNRGILAESEPLKAQLQIIQNKIEDHQILSPISGTILTKLVEPFEFVSVGKPLFKIADLNEMKLRAYSTAGLLQNVALNDEVTVLVDDGKETYRKLSGRLIWIASEAEFTPENIQTKEDRVGLVYAIDILVQNDGSLKIGMPGEVVFSKEEN